MKAIRLGLVGSGGMARTPGRCFCGHGGLSANGTSCPQRAHTGAELAQRHEVELLSHWQALIERADIDAVAICTNNDSHAPIAAAALEAGKHVFLEYPLARSSRRRRSLGGLGVGDRQSATRSPSRSGLGLSIGSSKRRWLPSAAYWSPCLRALLQGEGRAPRCCLTCAFLGRLACFLSITSIRWSICSARPLGLRAMPITTV